MKMTEEDYVSGGGLYCPRCGERSATADGLIDVDGGTAFQNCSCSECGASWCDVYKLVGYSDLLREEGDEESISE